MKRRFLRDLKESISMRRKGANKGIKIVPSNVYDDDDDKGRTFVARIMQTRLPQVRERGVEEV